MSSGCYCTPVSLFLIWAPLVIAFIREKGLFATGGPSETSLPKRGPFRAWVCCVMGPGGCRGLSRLFVLIEKAPGELPLHPRNKHLPYQRKCIFHGFGNKFLWGQEGTGSRSDL